MEQTTNKQNYFKWLLGQLKGWPQQNYYLFFFSLGCQIMTLVSNPITPVAIITFIGTTLGVLCVLAINATKAINRWLEISKSGVNHRLRKLNAYADELRASQVKQ